MKTFQYKQRVTVEVYYTDAETEEPAYWDWNWNEFPQAEGYAWIELVEWEEPERLLYPRIFD